MRCKAGSNTLCGFCSVYAFFLMTSLRDDFGKLFSVPRTGIYFFEISETKAFRQGKVVISKSVSFFFDKRRSCRIVLFSILYSWQWPHKGLGIVNFERRIASMPGTRAGQPFCRALAAQPRTTQFIVSPVPQSFAP